MPLNRCVLGACTFIQALPHVVAQKNMSSLISNARRAMKLSSGPMRQEAKQDFAMVVEQAHKAARLEAKVVLDHMLCNILMGC